MLTSLTAGLFIPISIGLVIGLIVLLALQIIMSMRVQRLTSPLYEYARSRSQEEADRIVNDAKETARKITADAQNSAAALVAAQKADIEARAHDYQSALQTLAMSGEAALKEGTQKAAAAHAELLERLAKGIESDSTELKKRIERMAADLDALLKQSQSQVSEIHSALESGRRAVVEGLAQQLSDVSLAGKKRIEEQVDGLVKEAAEDIDAYRASRKQLVDEHMADLIAESSKIVLRKALTPDEHGELVVRALEEARSSGML